MIGPRHRIAVAAASLVLLAAVVPLAGATGPMPGTQTAKLTLPAGGDGTVTRSPMPASSTTGSIAVTMSSNDDAFFDTLTTYLLKSKPTFGARAVSCVLLYSSLVNYPDDHTAFSIENSDLQDLFLNVCIHLALSLSQQGNAAQRAGSAATAKCLSTSKAVPVKITRSGSGYTATVNGTSYTPKSSAVRIACSRTTRGLKITERAAKRNGKLSGAIGPVMGVGFSSTSNSSGTLKIALGVR